MAFTGVPWLDAGMAVGQIGFGIADAIGQNDKYRDMLKQSKEEQARINRSMVEGQQRTDATSGNLQTAYNVERNADKASMSANIFLNTLQGWRQEKMGLEGALASERANYGNIKSQIRSGWDIAGTALGQGMQAASSGMDKYNTDNLMKSQIGIQNSLLKKEGLPEMPKYMTFGDALSNAGKSFSNMFKSSDTVQANNIASNVPQKVMTDNDIAKSTFDYMKNMNPGIGNYNTGLNNNAQTKLLGQTWKNPIDKGFGLGSNQDKKYNLYNRNILDGTMFNPYTNSNDYNPWR